MRRRLDLASVIERPRLLFLDEPSTGLDPRSREALWAGVRELVDDGVTVMVKRCVRRSLRDPEAFFTALTLPVVLLLLFVYVFGGALGRRHYADYVVPGLIVLCASFGARRPRSRSPPTCPGGSSTGSTRCRSRAPRSCSGT